MALVVAATATALAAPRADHPSSGTVIMRNSRVGAVLSARGLAVGQERKGSVRILNSGTLAAGYRLDVAVTGSRLLARELRVLVYRDRDRARRALVYRGRLAGLRKLRLGRFAARGAAGDRHRYFFHVSLGSTGVTEADNRLQGLSVNARFTWSATALDDRR